MNIPIIAPNMTLNVGRDKSSGKYVTSYVANVDEKRKKKTEMGQWVIYYNGHNIDSRRGDLTPTRQPGSSNFRLGNPLDLIIYHRK